MTYPTDRKYTKEHEWVAVSDGIATMGISAFAQEELGEIVFVELPEVGSSCGAGDSLCVVESTKAASDVYAPIAGTVKEVNDQLQDSPEIVNSDPHGNGWMVKFENIQEESLEGLMSAEEYTKFLEEK